MLKNYTPEFKNQGFIQNIPSAEKHLVLYSPILLPSNGKLIWPKCLKVAILLIFLDI